MTETSRPVFQGQIEAPNPIELFWERNKRLVVIAAVALVVVMAVSYGRGYYKQQQTNARWSEVAVATGLDKAYAEESAYGFFLKQQQQGQFGGFGGPQTYISLSNGELITKLREHLGATNEKELAKAIKDAAGSSAEPLLLWVAATRACQKHAWSQAETLLSDLEKRFPKHFLCQQTSLPPQWREEIKDNEDADTERKGRKRAQEPELAPPVAGSPVSLLRARIAGEKEFRTKNAWLYKAPEPDAKPIVVIKLSNDEEFKIRFYSKDAPEHVKSFLAKCKAGFYKGQTIDEVHREGSEAANSSEATRELHFGLVASKEADRTKWDKARNEKSQVQLDFEHNDLSHFPGMVAAANEPDRKKSSGERIWINANESASRLDGDRVIFGRVVEGLDVIEAICKQSFTDDNMETTGRGQLQQNIKIENVEIIE